jgi:CheY-like chemotaxis protein
MDLQTILLVDDEPDIRKIGQLALTAVGKWKAVLAASGAEALTKAAAEHPDLILLDVMMPDMDGPTTLGKLRAGGATSSIPIIFMTAKVQKAEVERYLKLGAVGVIAKPFDPMTLPEEIRRIVQAAAS